MANLGTKFMGIQLKSPIVVGACSLSKKVDTIKEIEAAGAGALVIKSLFQEQIGLEIQAFEEALNVGADYFAESLRYFPALEHAGPEEHLMCAREARKAVKMPLIGSINADSMGAWVDYATRMEKTGIDALELNFYSVEVDPERTAAQIEKELCDVVNAVKAKVKIPVAVKLSPYYTSVASVAHAVVEAGADGLTLFNRFYQPDIDVDRESLRISLDYSVPSETRLPLRWIAILSSQLGVDFAASTGVHTGRDVVRHLLAGASVAQVVSALYIQGIPWIGSMNEEVSRWMDSKGYDSIEDFRGKVNQEGIGEPYAFERAQYIKLLLGHD